ncbi:MAG: hypothetical protein IT442_00775 [Phycisphaeraceae bacterium]|nr:hypothetical protein [Phycisphaeraceae bacterium]
MAETPSNPSPAPPPPAPEALPQASLASEPIPTGRIVRWSLILAGSGLLAVAGIILQFGLVKAVQAELWSAMVVLAIAVVHGVGLGLGVAAIVGWYNRGSLLAAVAVVLANVIGLALMIW